MRSIDRIAKVVLIVLLAGACGPGHAEEEDGPEEEDGHDTSTPAPLGAWGKIYCAPLGYPIPEGGFGQVCYGLPDGANYDNGMAYVEPRCLLEYRAKQFGYEITEGYEGYCADGTTPQQVFEEQFCITDPDGYESGCFGGSDGWFTRLLPGCSLDNYIEQDDHVSCEGTQLYPDNFWDGVRCGQALCTGTLGDIFVELSRGELDNCIPAIQWDLELLDDLSLDCLACEGEPGSRWCECDGQGQCDEGLMCRTEVPIYTVAVPLCEPVIP